MEQIVITHPNGERLHLFSKQRPSTISKATQKVALLSDDLLSITLSSAEPLNIGLGDVINVYGRGYRINQLPSITKAGERRYDYELTLEGAQYDLLDVTFQLPEGCYGENLYTDLAGMINALNWNVRRVFGTKWTISTSLTGTAYKNLTVTGKNCLQVAQEICSEFEVEFKVTITGDTVTMEFVNSVGITHDFTLKYGKGKGLYQLQRTNVNNAGVTTRLFCFGSGENLGNSYRHTKLCLPDKTRLTSYIEDAAAIAEYGVKEGEKVFEDIRPERVGSVTAFESGDILSFYDTAMDFDLNAKDGEGNTIYLIPDTPAQIKFVSGNLGGYTFDLHSYDHASKKFTINQFTDENGVKFPDISTAARQFAAGDEYIITQINLPSSYITAAETKLQTEGTAALAKISQPQVSYKLTLDERFFIAKYGRIDTEPLHVGDSIPIQDTEVGVDKAVRITRIERDLLRPHSYEITLSDTVTKNTTVKVINEIQDINETIYTSGIADVSKMRRRWMAVKELQEMVFDPDGYFDPENIKPLSVETSMLTVAAKSQQFALLGSLFQPNLGGACNDFYAQACSLAHYALFDYIVTFSLTGCTYSTANGNPLNTTTAYYIYARCSKNITSQHTGTGDLILSTTQYKAEDSVGGVDYFFFLIGVLNSAVDGVRAISLTYGATTINGAFITTGKITSKDGNCYVDLDGNAMAFKDEQFTKGLSWNHHGDGKLKIKGGLVVNGGGDEGTIGLHRGVYNTTYTYYPGDEVTYTVDGITSTYRHIGGADGITPTTGVAPTNTTYWMILANGKVGQSSYKSIMFVRMNATPTKPADNKGSYAIPSPAACLAGQNSDGNNVYWSDGIPSGTNTIWATSRIFTSDGLSPQQSAWSTPRPMSDTDTFDVEFAKMQTNDATPADPDDTNRHGGSGTQIWFDPVNDSSEDFTAMYWRAERECKNGVWGNWTIVRIKGEKGASTPYQGVYDSTRTYYGTLRRTDVVKYNNLYYVARADVGSFMNKLPTDTDYWNDFGAEFDSVATQLLFAEFAYVENLGVRDLQTAQSGKRVHISGDDNAMTIYDEDGNTSAVFSGEQYTDSELFGGADQAVTPTNVDHDMQTGNALYPNMTYNNTVDCGSFNFPYAGVFSGQVVLKVTSTGSYSISGDGMSQVYNTGISVYLDNAYLGSMRSGDIPETKQVTININKGIAAGNHSLKVKISVSNPNYTSGSYQINAMATFSNCKCSADIRMARYFANGHAVGCSASQYMEALLKKVGTAEKLLYKVRAGNCGIHLYDGTLQIMIAGTWYNCSRDSGTGALKLTAAT